MNRQPKRVNFDQSKNRPKCLEKIIQPLFWDFDRWPLNIGAAA